MEIGFIVFLCILGFGIVYLVTLYNGCLLYTSDAADE